MPRWKRRSKKGGRKMQNKLLGSLGLCRRAGALVMGTDAVKDAVLSGSACLVLCARDVSQGSSQRVQRLCQNACPVQTMPLTMEELAGLLHRSVGVLAVTDENLATLCRKNLPQGEQ